MRPVESDELCYGCGERTEPDAWPGRRSRAATIHGGVSCVRRGIMPNELRRRETVGGARDTAVGTPTAVTGRGKTGLEMVSIGRWGAGAMLSDRVAAL